MLYIGEDPRLEAEVCGEVPRAVITHPHPLYGGNMDNNVVLAAREAAREAGFGSLRFNFRGVGRSGGVHDEGRGEVADLGCAVSQAGAGAILIGYSFGAWVAAHFLQAHPMPAVLIAPPNAMFAFPDLAGHQVWAISGTNDQFCRTAGLDTFMPPGRCQVVPGVDHFWFGMEGVLDEFLQPLLEELFSTHP